MRHAAGLVAYNPRKMRYHKLDLNLLTVLDTLLEERSVARAAARLYISRPAVSNALARLRELLDDPLLVKTQGGMEPTGRALALIAPVREALAVIEAAVRQARGFDPAATQAELRVAMGDYVAEIFLPGLVQRLSQLAPRLVIAARYMRQDFFEYMPQFKLLIAGNHKPGLRSVDEAIRRRFHLLPFAVTIPPGERDPRLREKLKGEWPGILRWLVDGCLDWRRQGLAPPAAVTEATAAYLDAEDAVSAWADECCLRDPQVWESSSKLYASWKGWATRNGEPEGTVRRFSQTLEARGFTPARKKNGRGFQGLSIIRADNNLPYWVDR